MATRIVLVDDHKIIRQGLRLIIDREDELTVVGEADSGRTALDAVRELNPDVVVMDIHMPDLNGIEATRRIADMAPCVRVIALSMHEDKRFVTEMLRAGASAYLLKDCASEELVRAIRLVVTGQTYLSPRVAGVIVQAVSRLRTESMAFTVLSGREREMLQMLAEGNSVKAIAATLHVSVKTVETHRQNIMRKTGAGSLAELTKYALREGLTFLDT